jgi:hexosaminidase
MRVFKKKFWVTSDVKFRAATPIPDDLYEWIVKEVTEYYFRENKDNDLDDWHSTEFVFHLAPFKRKVPEDYYELKVDTNLITLSAETPNGLRHAVQTLKQHIYESSFNHEYDDDPAVDMQCLEIRDWPSFPWRGLHLDVSRHFFDYKFVRRYLEIMASLKLNKFHWHLSDDQGWRLECKRFPKLHEVGAWRIEADGSRYGGYYTQKQVKLVLEHAAKLGIEVVPEIDIPGHAQAILASYSDLACFPKDFETLNVWGISEDILCAGKDRVIEFLKELFTEVAELFPGQYIHLGGDEAPKDRWKECPQCQERIRMLKLTSENELQGWLVKTLARHLEAMGKTVIGWDETLDGKIDSKPIVMAWRGDGLIAANRAHNNGNRYIICPNNKLYFDWRISHLLPDTTGRGVTTIQDVYELDLRRFRFGKDKLFLGGQANLWTEYITDMRMVKQQLEGRLQAMAELFWADPQEKDINTFWQNLWYDSPRL